MRRILAVLLLTVMMMPAGPAMAEKEEPAPVTVTFFRGEPGEQPAENNRIYQKIEKELGIRFRFEFLTSYLDEMLGMKILHPSQLPDLIDGSNSSDMLVDAGVLTDLMPYISEETTPFTGISGLTTVSDRRCPKRENCISFPITVSSTTGKSRTRTALPFSSRNRSLPGITIQYRRH